MKLGWTQCGVLIGLIVGGMVSAMDVPVAAAQDRVQDRALSGRAKARDANKNGVIDRDEARGPLADNFDTMDCDKSGALDGAEIRGFFSGSGCPEKSAAAAAPAKPQGGDTKALSGRAKGLDANANGTIEKGEARGPLAGNFDTIDKDKSGALDGAEIRSFFQGGGAAGSQGGGARAGNAGGAKGPGAKAGSPGGARRGGRRPARVMIDDIVVQPVARTFPVIGRLVARQSGVIASEISGILSELRVNVGDRVGKNDVIATISKDRLLSDRARFAASVGRYKGLVATARSEYEKKQHELRRLERLRRSAAFSRARYEDLKRDVQSRRGVLEEKQGQLREAEALVKRAQIDLRDTEIRAPFPGVVSEKHTDVGTYLRSGDRVATVVNDRDMEIEAEVPSNRLHGLKTGVSVKVMFTDGSRHTATVRAIVPVENARTRTRPVRFAPQFDGVKSPLAANQSVTVEVPVASVDKAVTVHKDAVVRDDAKSFVYVLQGNMARRREVSLGEAVGARFIVRNGVKPGDKVVVRGNESLGRGRPVRVVGSIGG